jgi:hypothetical protein
MKKYLIFTVFSFGWIQVTPSKVDDNFLNKINQRIEKINSLRGKNSQYSLNPGRRVSEQQERYLKKIKNIIPQDELNKLRAGFKKQEKMSLNEVNVAYINYRKNGRTQEKEKTAKLTQDELNSLDSALSDFTLQELKKHQTLFANKAPESKKHSLLKDDNSHAIQSTQNLKEELDDGPETRQLKPVNKEEYAHKNEEGSASKLPTWGAKEGKVDDEDGLFTRLTKAYKRNTTKLEREEKKETTK